MANNFYAIYPPIEGGVASNPSVGPNGLPAPLDSTEIGFIDGSGNLQGVSAAQPLPVTVISGPNPTNVNLADVAGVVTPVGAGASNAGTQRVILSSDSPLAPGASTSALQTSGNSSLASILANQTNGTQETSIVGTVPLPTGAATSANQTTEITALGTINTTLGSPMQQTGGSVSVTNFPATQPISAVSLPLPTGASTSALQSTINTTLGSPFQAGGSIGNTAFGISGSLPAGTNTIGKVDILGNAGATLDSAAGTPNSQAITIQGNASGVAVPVSGTITATPPTLPSAPLTGQKTSTGTAVAISSTSQPLVNGVIVQALSTNAGLVYVGGSGVTTSTGFQLQAGQATSTAVNNLNEVYVISVTSGDGVCFIGS